MSDQYGSGPSDRSGATPWNPPSQDQGAAPADQTRYAGDTSTPSSPYPESAYGQPGHTAGGRPDTSGRSDQYGGATPVYEQPGQTSDQYGTQSQYGAQGQYGAQAPAYGTTGAAYDASGPYGYDKPKGLAIASLVLGILALLGFWFPIVGGLLGLVAIILGVLALRRVKKGTGGGKGLAIAGIVTGALALLGNILVTVAFGAALTALSESGSIDGIVQCSQLPTQAEQQQCFEQLSNTSGLEEGVDNT